MDLVAELHCATPIARDRDVALQIDTSSRWPLCTKISSSPTRKDQALEMSEGAKGLN